MYDEFDNDPEIEAEAREAVADMEDENFKRHADYDWDRDADLWDDPPYEGEYAEYEGTEGVKPPQADNICTECDGTGEVGGHLCKDCQGKGYFDE